MLGKDYSYGCAVPEKIGETTFPNTSCVSSDGLIYYSAATCRALVPNCTDLAIQIERIYWQKTATNKWSADATVHASSGGAGAANYVDWSDSLESQIWWDTTSIRVETTPYADLTATQKGLTMWHVYGQGTTELWGARASEAGAPAVYDSGVAIVHTDKARLNIAKLSLPVDCALPYTSPNLTWTGSGWSGSLFTLYDVPYTAELNIGGKYVSASTGSFGTHSATDPRQDGMVAADLLHGDAGDLACDRLPGRRRDAEVSAQWDSSR